MNKVISVSNAWTCENMDFNAPINWEGYIVLFDDNTTMLIDNNDNIKFDFANEIEKKVFANKLGYVFAGDTVEIIKGRKIPVGSKKIVKGFQRYNVDGTYGHCFTEYLIFTDGTKTAITNVKVDGIETFNKNCYFLYTDKMPNFYRGGRI